MTHDELMKALLVERYTNPWWTADTTVPESEKRAAEERREVLDQGRIRRVS